MNRQPTYAECREASRSIRRAKFGRQAVATVRPRGALGIFRQRAPLPILLYVAARDGLIVWRGPDSLALLQPPADRPMRLVRTGVRMSALRFLNRHWDMLAFGVPPATALLLTLPLVAYVVATPAQRSRDVAVLLALLLVLVAVAYIAALMTVGLLAGVRWALRPLFRPAQSDDMIAVEQLPGVRWSLSLCHHVGPARADELLRAVSRRLKRLVTGPARDYLEDAGASARELDVTENLVCLRSGVTTQHMRDTIVEWTGSAGMFAPGGALAVKASGNRARRQPSRLFERGGFVFLYAAGVAVAVAVEALFVADVESGACARGGCEGRPATYPLALRWLAQRLFLTDPPHLYPATAWATLIGWLTSAMSVMGLLVFVTAVQLYTNYRRDKMQRYQEFEIDLNRRSRVLLLVATASEREAVFAAAEAITGREPKKRFLPHHTVYELDVIGDAEVLLAQTQPGAVGPGGAAITASALLSRLDPDFLVVTGVCFGLREDEQRLGDVIVCRQLRAIDHKKEREPEGGGPRTVLIRGDFVSSSVTLFDRFQSAEVGWTTAKVHYGTLLSSSTLVNSRELRAELLMLDPEASGGEMEGAGVYAAAAPERVDWIVVKGISDWGYDKNDDMQKVAARNAAAFVLDTIRSGALDDRPRGASLDRRRA